MQYLECLRTVFGGGAATPPHDAAQALARGAKRLRTVIETETRAGQALAASWAGTGLVTSHAEANAMEDHATTSSGSCDISPRHPIGVLLSFCR